MECMVLYILPILPSTLSELDLSLLVHHFLLFNGNSCIHEVMMGYTYCNTVIIDHLLYVDTYSYQLHRLILILPVTIFINSSHDF